MIDPYENLAIAIVKSAAKDYLKAYKKYLRHPKKPGLYESVMREERFFQTEWYGILTNVDPDYLLDALKKKAKEEVKYKDESEEDDYDY